MISYFGFWRTTHSLCRAGLLDEALLCLVAKVPFTLPSDREVAAISEVDAEKCVIALDENVLWCQVAVPLGERIVRMLRSEKLALCVHAFEPNSAKVLSGLRAQLVPVASSPLGGLEIARRQPAGGFTTPHHVRASLKLGPRADIAGLRHTLNSLSETHVLAG